VPVLDIPFMHGGKRSLMYTHVILFHTLSDMITITSIIKRNNHKIKLHKKLEARGTMKWTAGATSLMTSDIA